MNTGHDNDSANPPPTSPANPPPAPTPTRPTRTQPTRPQLLTQTLHHRLVHAVVGEENIKPRLRPSRYGGSSIEPDAPSAAAAIAEAARSDLPSRPHQRWLGPASHRTPNRERSVSVERSSDPVDIQQYASRVRGRVILDARREERQSTHWAPPTAPSRPGQLIHSKWQCAADRRRTSPPLRTEREHQNPSPNEKPDTLRRRRVGRESNTERRGWRAERRDPLHGLKCPIARSGVSSSTMTSWLEGARNDGYVFRLLQSNAGEIHRPGPRRFGHVHAVLHRVGRSRRRGSGALFGAVHDVIIGGAIVGAWSRDCSASEAPTRGRAAGSARF